MKLSVIILIVCIITCCGDSPNEKKIKNIQPPKKERINPFGKPVLKLKKSNSSPSTQRKRLENSSLDFNNQNQRRYPLTDTIIEDFTGDDILDYAFFKLQSDKRALFISNGANRKAIKIGFGHPNERLNYNFDWVGSWGVLSDSLTFEIVVENGEVIGDSIVQIHKPSIWVKDKDELGGGVISFKGGKYVWIHQAD
jgi:hypothetical protein